MSKIATNKPDINKNKIRNGMAEDNFIEVTIKVPREESKYFTDTLTLLSKLTNNNKPVLHSEPNINEFGRIALNFLCNSYKDNVFGNPGILKKIRAERTLKQFIIYRAKYMGYPVEVQLGDLEDTGILRRKNQR